MDFFMQVLVCLLKHRLVLKHYDFVVISHRPILRGLDRFWEPGPRLFPWILFLKIF